MQAAVCTLAADAAGLTGAVAAFESALFTQGTNWTEVLLDAVLEDENLCLRTAAGGDAGPVLEKAMDDALLEMYRPFRFQICPERAAAYFLAVQRETAAVRLILAGKQNGFDAENIRERLRDLYV